ncbi:MAG: tRNA 2-thiouridine(34) synthase MnmA [Promicromonosporaceae bacterium]|nr:tRNA 2-thiouridine(34) synthase MnmA [Promicromonosporaceae bacterium]
MKVLAAMSGGVDSAMAAALAVEAGHEVVGVHMALLRDRELFRDGSRGCCSIEDSLDARRVADKLGIPFYIWDLSESFQESVVDDFLSEYAAGRTPNPCIRCNEHVKFATLAARADSLGFDAVATGHYARLEPGGQLFRGANRDKDQSYVLAVAGPERLSRALFPLGDFATKAEVRAAAAERGFAVSNKPDSYDICFIPDGDTRGFLRERLGSLPGVIVDQTGTEIGRHDGAYAYTVGQRSGLALGNPASDGKPRYVVSVDVGANVVVVGPKEALEVASITARDPIWYAPPSRVGETPMGIQVRAHGREIPAQVSPDDDGGVTFRLLGEKLRGIAAGQSVVAYQGERVVVQATISGAIDVAQM